MAMKLPNMVYIYGEEMTKVVMGLVLDKWIKPNFDISNWQFFDLSCAERDKTNDQVLKDAIEAGAKVGAIFKEPTITPTAEQVKSMGLSQQLGSPNGKMREAWNGYTISRDTIMIPGVKLGYKNKVIMERHAVGGEYKAGWKLVGKGKLETLFYPAEGGAPIIVDKRELEDNVNAAVVYNNPYDNIKDFAHNFYTRCLEENLMPTVVSKRTVFKFQEAYWQMMRDIFNNEYKDKFTAKGLLKHSGGELMHIISDDAAMKLVKWTDGNFGMAALNYDGDWLSDEMAQIHRSPGFMSSVLVGKFPDGRAIMEFEASHGTIADQYHKHLKGEETSVNPLGLVFALIGAINHSATLAEAKSKIKIDEMQKIHAFTDNLYKEMTGAMAAGHGTKDLYPSNGLSTEQFIQYVAIKVQFPKNGVQR